MFIKLFHNKFKKEILANLLFFIFSFTSNCYSQIIDIGDTLSLNSLNFGLVGHYPFSGNAGDSSGQGNHGTLKNGVALTTDRNGVQNSAYLFDGTNDYIEIPDDISLRLTDSFSITLWLNQHTTAAGGYRLFDKTTVGINDGYNFDTYGSSGRKLRLTGGSGANVEANATFPLNAWNQVLVIHYKDTTYLYQNSKQIGKDFQQNIGSTTLPVRIGSNQNGGNYFDGKIDDIRVYNRALCDLEIKVVYGTILKLGAKAKQPNICSGNRTFINISNPQPYVRYSLHKQTDSSIVGTPISSPCSDTLRFVTDTITQNTTFILKAYDPAKSDSIYLDTTITVKVAPSYNDTVDTVLCGGSAIFFAGAVRSTSGYYVGNFKTTNGCDSIVTLHLIKDNITTHSQTISICSGDSIFLQKAYRKVAGNYVDTTERLNQCDSITSTTLSIISPTSSSQNVSICNGDSILIHGNYLKNQGVYYDTLTSQTSGCDSIVETTLSVNPIISLSQNTSICTGDSILVNGRYLKTQGTYTDTLQSTSTGCDSILTTNLTLSPILSYSQSISICNGDSILLQNEYRKTAGTFYDTAQSLSTCDSVMETTLSIIFTSTSYTAYTICVNDSILINSRYLKDTGIYYDTLIAIPSGCDSIATTEINFRDIETDTVIASICNGDSLFLLKDFYKSSGSFVDSVFTNGCLDSISWLNLTILPTSSSLASYTICSGDSIVVAGKWTQQAGIYYDSLKNNLGCDSIITINLNISTPPTHIDNINFCFNDSAFVNGEYYYNDTTIYDTLSTISGCDSVIVTKLQQGKILLELDDSVFYCENVYAELDAGNGFNSYLWSNGSSSQSTKSNKDELITITVIDSFNCVTTDSVRVLERCGAQIFIPSSFTPNGDGLNDFFIFNADNVDRIDFKVFNRWGEQVFSTNNKNVYWNGTYKNEALPVGIYIWIVSYDGKNVEGRIEKRNEKGILQIIR